MIYRDFQDLKLSALGMGAMRLPVIDGNDGVVDEKAAAEMVDYAMSQGVNYYGNVLAVHLVRNVRFKYGKQNTAV